MPQPRLAFHLAADAGDESLEHLSHADLVISKFVPLLCLLGAVLCISNHVEAPYAGLRK